MPKEMSFMKSRFIPLLAAAVLLATCSDNNEEQDTHVWQEQTATIEKAKAVEGILQESAEDQRRHIREESE